MPDMKAGIQKELSRLLTERPALESEMKTAFAAIDSAPHMTPDLRESLHAFYNRKYARIQTDISDMMGRYLELGGDADALP